MHRPLATLGDHENQLSIAGQPQNVIRRCTEPAISCQNWKPDSRRRGHHLSELSWLCASKLPRAICTPSGL